MIWDDKTAHTKIKGLQMDTIRSEWDMDSNGCKLIYMDIDNCKWVKLDVNGWQMNLVNRTWLMFSVHEKSWPVCWFIVKYSVHWSLLQVHTLLCMLNHDMLCRSNIDMLCRSNMRNIFQVACWHSIWPRNRLLCDSGDLFKNLILLFYRP